MIGAAFIMALACTNPQDWCDNVNAMHRVDPVYPQMAAGFGVNAICRALYDIDESGRPVNLCVRCATGLERPVPPRAQAIIAQQFVQASEVSIGQWVYGAEHHGYVGTRSQFVYLLEGQDEDMLPEPPAMGECLGPQIA